ncbi:threonine-phosphate decarboxylase CobD [Novispirillum sp. DQ9]|uniref:threonine-phosphate decarboxylase CobD n=1 Tax=Novispirillum sp. DQ9 TaxID=3398612 RepID=UPI003C7C2AD6
MSGPLFHGGDIAGARVRFPDAPEPWVDLSTGINPHPYPVPPLSPQAFTRLPDRDALDRLLRAAAARYGAPSPAHVVAAPGTQSLLPTIARMAGCGVARVLSPTYAEHARACALAGHAVQEVDRLEDLAGADLAIVVNPNNPDGRLHSPDALRALAGRVGLLLVDEAFLDTGGEAMDALVDALPLVVLRSFGKFYGLAGVRLGFAVCAPARAEALRAVLGPWAVSGMALEIGAAALEDGAWAEATRARLVADAARLDGVLAGAGLRVIGGTPLFRLVSSPDAPTVHERLCRTGILIRPFPTYPDRLRFGLPGTEEEWQRLERALRP